MRTNYQIIFPFILSFLLILSKSQAQSPVWYLDPVFTDIDDIDLEKSTNDIIIVKKGGSYGMRTRQNVVIIPTNYVSPVIYPDSKALSVFDGKQMLYFDYEGYAISKESGEKAFSLKDEVRRRLEREQILESGKLFRVYANNKQNFINKNLDTILKLTDTNHPRLFDDTYYVSEGKQFSKVFDKKGNYIKTLEAPPSNLAYHKQGFYTNRYAKKAYLYDKDFNPIDIGNSSGVRFEEGHDIMIFDYNSKYIVKDLTMKNIFEDTLRAFPHFLKDTKKLFVALQNETQIYNFQTGEKEVFPLITNFSEKTGSQQIVKDSDNKYGVFDFIQKINIIPCQHDYMTLKDGLYFGRFGDKKSKHFEIFNSKGLSLFNGFYAGVQANSEGFIVTDTLKNKTWFDYSGKPLKQFSKDYNVDINQNANTVRVTKINVESKVYFIKDYLTSDKPKSYEDVGSRLNPKEKNMVPLFIVKMNGKYGIIDYQGNIVQEPVFTNHFSFYDDKWVVEYKGKVGAIIIPKIDMK